MVTQRPSVAQYQRLGATIRVHADQERNSSSAVASQHCISVPAVRQKLHLSQRLHVALLPAAAGAGGRSCDHAASQSGGILFKTFRAISAFGNAGCRYDNEYNVPLSQKDRNLVEAIQREERYRRCP